ncbi:sulfatase [Paraflavitalea pollutisoli]|uniref:sulfatase n=1 Tax=Paraflavitalea pollutisoli TaxID=3034143 RepID=UPI0023EE1F8D|nr:sulfatase [Paraflavitalea sp. H1-2-19X]
MKCILLAAMLFTVPALAQQAPKKNVLFIIVDDMKPLLGCYGDTNARTPFIDRLAARSRVFDRAYAQQAVCAPSRSSFLTGRRPDQLKIWGLSQPFRPLHPHIVTLPQHFKNNGYTTAATGKIYHDPATHHDPASWSLPGVLEVTGNGIGAKYALATNAGQSKAASVERVDIADSGYIDGKVADAAIQLLDQLKDQPFFLAVGFRRPHLPFTAPEKYWKPFDGKQFALPDTSRPQDAPAIAFHNSEELRGYTDIPDKGPIPDSKVKELLQGYYAAVSYTDAQIGKVLNELDRLQLTQNTIVVLISDHGFHLGDHSMWGKSTNFENAARVPLLISAPGIIRQPGHTQALAELVDLYPTLAQLCGLHLPDSLAGTSLLPIVQNAKANVKQQALSQFIRPYGALSNESRTTHMGYSLRTAQYRLTEWYDTKTQELVATELYDHEKDPHEMKNLAAQAAYANRVKALHQQLQRSRQ